MEAMDTLKKKASAAASAAAPVAGAALSRAGSAVEAAAPVVAKGAEKAVSTATDVASAAKEKALQNDAVADMYAKHGAKAEAAGGYVMGALSKAFTPSARLREFAKNPTQEGLLANPDLVFESLALLNAARHPKAAAMSGVVKEGMERASKSDAVLKAQESAVQEGINKTMRETTGGVVASVPPEVTKAMTDFVRQNPQEALNMMKMAAPLAAQAAQVAAKK